MSRKGNPMALMKAVRRNPKMSYAAKRKALSTLRNQVRAVPRGRSLALAHHVTTRRRSTRDLGIEGAREAGWAVAKLVSRPLNDAVEIYHVGAGLHKIRRWLNRRR